jgi:hypothetical protein
MCKPGVEEGGRGHRHFPKLANRLYRHPNVRVDLDLHPIWPAAKKHLERGNTCIALAPSMLEPTGCREPSAYNLSLAATGRRPIRPAFMLLM